MEKWNKKYDTKKVFLLYSEKILFVKWMKFPSFYVCRLSSYHVYKLLNFRFWDFVESGLLGQAEACQRPSRGHADLS